MHTLGELYERNAHLYPRNDAFVCREKRVSHGLFLERIKRLASAIENAGARRQHRVGLFSANNIECFEAYGACEWAGFILAAYNFRSAGPELSYLLSDSMPTVLIFEASRAAVVDTLRLNFPGIKRFVAIGEARPDWATDYEAFLLEGAATGSRIQSRAQDVAHIFYTSGTTGRPKGVPGKQSAALITAERTARGEMSVLQVTPAFHVGGRGPALGASWAGGKTVIQSSFEPAAFMEAVQRERINTTFMVPPMIQAVLDHPDFERYDLSSLDWVMSGSTVIPLPLLYRALDKIGPVFYIAYGSTEAFGVTRLRKSETRAGISAEQDRRLSSVGHFETPVDGCILDPEGKPLGPGEIGEVCVKSYSFEGYWNNSVATIEAMHGDYFRTGDLGYMDAQGYLFLVDRLKDMIISGGENIYSREVETALERHPGVLEAAVIGEPDQKWGEAVHAIVVTQPGVGLTAEALSAFAGTQIAKFKCPKRISFIDEMPRLSTGKIDKMALRRKNAAAAG